MKITQEWYAKKMIGAGDLFMQLNWTIDQGIGYQAQQFIVFGVEGVTVYELKKNNPTITCSL